jgi:hypothetical protein
MGTVIIAAFILAAGQPDADSGLIGTIDRMDREMSGLLDAYLEAVPECPVRADTPVRIWVMDLAWIRATAAFDEAYGLRPSLPPDQLEAWNAYLKSSSAYLALFRSVRDVYSAAGLPDSSLSLEMETQLIDMDSLWLESEAGLLAIYSEEDPR